MHLLQSHFQKRKKTARKNWAEEVDRPKFRFWGQEKLKNLKEFWKYLNADFELFRTLSTVEQLQQNTQSKFTHAWLFGESQNWVKSFQRLDLPFLR